MGVYRVAGEHIVAGVEPGGTVELDPDVYNIPALVAAGHLEPVPDDPEPEAPAGRPERKRREAGQ